MTQKIIVVAIVSFIASWAQADQCRTQSNGRSFQASTRYDVIRQCQADFYTSNSECEREVQCRDDYGSNNNYGPNHNYGSNNNNSGPSHGGNYPPSMPQQPSQPSHQSPAPQQPQQPTQSAGPTHSLPAGSYTLSCRNASMSGTYLSADCRDMRGRWVYSQLNLNLCDGGDVGNNDGRLNCHPR